MWQVGPAKMSALHLIAGAAGQESKVLSKRSGETRLVAIAYFVRHLVDGHTPSAEYRRAG